MRFVLSLLALVVLLPIARRLLASRAGSLRSRFDREASRLLDLAGAPPMVTDADLAPLPLPVQRYLRRVGVVGKPRVRNLRASFRATMRSAPGAGWMTATVEQVEAFDPPARLFFKRASRSGVPFEGLHRYVGSEASMDIRVLGLIPVVDVHGREMTQSETVTLFNDMCILAPSSLIGAPVTWESVDDRSVRATYTNAGYTIGATLTFDAAGDLVGFVSGDRYLLDGRSVRRAPWSTPMSGYREFGGFRLAAVGEARWLETAGEWTYGRFELTSIEYNQTVDGSR